MYARVRLATRGQLAAVDFYKRSYLVLLLQLPEPGSGLLLATCDLSQLAFQPKVRPRVFCCALHVWRKLYVPVIWFCCVLRSRVAAQGSVAWSLCTGVTAYCSCR